LAVVSKHDFMEIDFNSFTIHGAASKIFVDGEILAKKGVGRVRIVPAGTNQMLDVFITHTVADPDPAHGYDNSEYRKSQIEDLLEKYILKSEADIVILGGDFNAVPSMEKGSPYQMIQEHMTNCIEEINGLGSNFATYGNMKNTFTGGKEMPVIYDYIFHRANNKAKSWASDCRILYLETTVKKDSNDEMAEISVSDHQGVEAIISFWN